MSSIQGEINDIIRDNKFSYRCPFPVKLLNFDIFIMFPENWSREVNIEGVDRRVRDL